jgi:hypothetical protein
MVFDGWTVFNLLSQFHFASFHQLTRTERSDSQALTGLRPHVGTLYVYE